LFEPAGYHLQHPITRAVPKRVVDLLKAVKIKEHQAYQSAYAPRARYRLLQAVAEQIAIGQPGQNVILRELREALLGLAPLRLFVDGVQGEGDVARHLD